MPDAARLACIGEAEIHLAIGRDCRLPLAAVVRSLAHIPEILAKVG